MRVGLVGEDPNDTSSIENLLSPPYRAKKIKFIKLLKNIRGWQLDSIHKVKRALAVEFEYKKCDFVIYIRDSDGPSSDKIKINIRKEWFKHLDDSANKKGLLLLNIYELEALILADIGSFNKMYRTDINYKQNPSFEKDPKEFLMRKTINSQRKYKESDCPEIFSKLNIETVKRNCTYFKNFISEFESRI